MNTLFEFSTCGKEDYQSLLKSQDDFTPDFHQMIEIPNMNIQQQDSKSMYVGNGSMIVPSSEPQTFAFLKDNSYMDLSPYFYFTLSDLARTLGARPSTLSKRIAASGRKWPRRQLLKIDKQLAVIIKNTPKEGHIQSNHRLKELVASREQIAMPLLIRSDFIKHPIIKNGN